MFERLVNERVFLYYNWWGIWVKYIYRYFVWNDKEMFVLKIEIVCYCDFCNN